ncbi:DUF4105 domain-containing protein [Halobacteriovorax sp. GB3]|uniref:DUF7844 domain-containing protein n=1 Tax=Halobacteriovorax sp. GB3 TaxID=2719615 RepID=UPI0023617F1D|nr:DUF4105 domain-containing protein [Halobacteriovorax sp. GB3]MDD0853087.1 DUF4105 domain-containing protein [Halobacteriovorax sp. GB3]
MLRIQQLIFLCLCFVFGAQSSFAFVTKSDLLKDAVDDILKVMPESMQRTISKSSLRIELSTLNQRALNTPCDNLPYNYGYYEGNTILIDRALFESSIEESEDSEDFSCKHKTFEKTLKATLIHELFHYYDLRKAKSVRLENNPTLLSLGFWNKKGKKNFNHFAKRSMDRYEYENRREFAAVNFEYFILDSSYKCRRPNLYRFFRDHFNFNPSNVSCEKSVYQVSMTDTRSNEIVEIDKSKVREIHYLFASEGSAIYSRFGHAMFKILLCDPSVDLDTCRRRGKSVVLGFLAENVNVKLNLYKGIFGKYQSRLLVSDLVSMKMQYNREEFRNLESYPLQFNKVQRDRFIDHFVRIYWEYAGKYYFFTNNCADEAFRLLQVAFNYKWMYEKNVLSPKSILKYLKKKNLVDSSVLEDRSYARKHGLFYPSFLEPLSKSYKYVYNRYPRYFKVKKTRRTGGEKSREMTYYDRLKTVDEYLELSLEQRKEVLSNLIEANPSRKVLLSMLPVEMQAHHLESNRILEEIQKETSINLLDESSADIFQEIVRLKNIILFETGVGQSGYGILQSNDSDEQLSDDQVPEVVLEAEARLVELNETMKDIFTDLFEERYTRLEESKSLSATIKEALTSAH